jgi:tetratricopeptide (TPR) repeat protein
MWSWKSKKQVEETELGTEAGEQGTDSSEQTPWARFVFGGFAPQVVAPSKWFESSAKLLDTITEQEAEDLIEVFEVGTSYDWAHDYVLEPTDFSLFEKVKFSDSQLGLSIMAQFDSMGLVYRFKTTKINLEGEGEDLREVHGDEPLNWPYNSLEVFLWLESGSPVVTQLEIYRREDSTEFAYWSTHLLATNINMAFGMGLGDHEVLDFSEANLTFFTEKYRIPTAMLKLAFMAETREVFMALGSRGKFHKSLPAKYYPKPIYAIEEFEEVWTAKGGEEGGVWGFIAPNAIKFGWMLDAPSMRSYKKQAPVVINLIKDGLIQALACVEEGWETARGLVLDETNSPPDLLELLAHNQIADYDFVFGNPAMLNEGPTGNLDGHPTWIPQTACFDLLTASRDLYNSDRDEECFMNGIGPAVPHAANSFAFGDLIPLLAIRGDDGTYRVNPEASTHMDRLREVLSKAVLAPSPTQATNAISNMGVAYFQVGELEKAEAHLLAALEREDGSSEHEACYVLSILYEERGDKESAQVFRQRYEKTQGYEVRSWFRTGPLVEARRGAASQGLTKSSKTTGFGDGKAPSVDSMDQVANFCNQCGTKFETPEAKFCSSCGQPR